VGYTIACWTIWKARNGIIFYNKAASLVDWKAALEDDLSLVIIRLRRALLTPFMCGEIVVYDVYFSFYLGFTSLVPCTYVLCISVHINRKRKK